MPRTAPEIGAQAMLALTKCRRSNWPGRGRRTRRKEKAPPPHTGRSPFLTAAEYGSFGMTDVQTAVRWTRESDKGTITIPIAGLPSTATKYSFVYPAEHPPASGGDLVNTGGFAYYDTDDRVLQVKSLQHQQGTTGTLKFENPKFGTICKPCTTMVALTLPDLEKRYANCALKGNRADAQKPVFEQQERALLLISWHTNVGYLLLPDNLRRLLAITSRHAYWKAFSLRQCSAEAHVFIHPVCAVLSV